MAEPGRPLRFALLGAGFWAPFQLAGWLEAGAHCVAIYNRTAAKARALAESFGVQRIGTDARAVIEAEAVDFIDVCTDVGTHRRFVELAAELGLPVVCQKPFAPTVADAEAMLAACEQAGVPLLINENWRWQTPVRALKAALVDRSLGRVFRARLHYCSSFPVFTNQPALAELDQFILADMGTHILDTARFLFGEPRSVYARTQRIHPNIAGEDVATVVMETADDCVVTCELSYASHTAIERFPEAFAFIEAEHGSLELLSDYRVRHHVDGVTTIRRHPPPRFAWANPAYDLVHASIVPAQANLLAHLAGADVAETTGADNLRTLRLVEAAYRSATSGTVIPI